MFRPWLLLGCLALILPPGLIDYFSPDHKWLTKTEKGHKLALVKEFFCRNFRLLLTEASNIATQTMNI